MNCIIIGASGHGKVILDILQYNLDIKVVGFVDDDQNFQNKVVNGVPVLGNFSSLPQLLQKHSIEGAIIAIGDSKTRARFFKKLKGMRLKLVNAIHPSAVISKNVKIGEGVMIAAGAVINTNTKIGHDVIINTGATVDHDNIIGDHVNIQPGANLGGLVTVKAYTEVGIGATVIQSITIGEDSNIGSGAAVIEDIPDSVIVVGVPAKIVKSKIG